MLEKCRLRWWEVFKWSVSHFLGCGKKTAWAAWTSITDLTDTLVALTNNPNLFSLESVHMRNLYSCTVRGLVQPGSMRPGIGSSLLETDHLKTSHQRKRHFSSMWSELYYKQVSTGRRPPWSSGKFPTSVNGAGTKMAPVHGNHYGQLSVMLQGHALFCCTVAASRHATEGANVNARVSNVRPSANVKVVVLITRVVITSSTDGQHYR